MLHSQEKLILENLVNVIIPADRDLNGWSAGVGDYLSRQFAGDLREMLTIYQQGLNALDSEALIVYEHGFCVISNSQREALLRQIEAGNIQSDVPIDLTVFFKNPEKSGFSLLLPLCSQLYKSKLCLFFF